MIRNKDTEKGEYSELGELGDQITAALRAAGNTRNLIDWEGLRARLANAPDPLTDAERIDLVVRVANTGVLTPRQQNRLVGLQVTYTSKLDVDFRLPEVERHGLRAVMALLVQDETGKELAEVDAALEGRIALLPIKGRTLTVAPAIRAALLYSATVAMRSGSLRQCGLESCGRFFVRKNESGRGRPRKYCPTCSELADNEMAIERMRQNRRKKR